LCDVLALVVIIIDSGFITNPC